MGAAVCRDDLIGAVAALRGIGPEDVLLNQSALELLPEAAARFRVNIKGCLDRTIHHERQGVGGLETANQGEAIFGLLVDVYLRSTQHETRNYRGGAPEKLVRLAEERFYASQGAPVSLADLCVAAGVSQATLYRAFHSVCDMPPLAYFQKRRLSDARRTLVNLSPQRGAVKYAAFSAGFTDLGRFSVEYRRLFGERPSATLNRQTP
ncbi:helix-turn-helix domain-containing protein [Roseibium sediminicola]|uniref:helix-turn-helix domain-containing protein n=1 Tax=Roseibium sediminicola TaxID=2933272 RepID=UPI003CE5C313